MPALRIMIFAPWPIRVPRHGGQIRGAAVVQAYRAAGHQVYCAGLYDNAFPPAEVWPQDLPLVPGIADAAQALTRENNSAMTFWEAVASVPDSFAPYVAAVRAARPQLLQFEEPALWPVVRRLRAEGHLDGVALVHSSYNFETLAWRERSTPGAPVNSATIRHIAALEREIAASCDLIVTVSESDAAAFRTLGAAQVCVAANGVAALATGDPRAVSGYLGADMPHALFVSSAHPPNAYGLVDMAAATTGHPVRHGEILICGRVVALLRAAANFGKAGRILDRARYLGWVDNALLDALYAATRVVILPKTLGGGSNLKTAEALASGRPIVATRRAFDGFEPFIDLPGVTIADEPNAFWTAVDELLSGRCDGAQRPPESMAGLLWAECLKPMVRAAEGLAVR